MNIGAARTDLASIAAIPGARSTSASLPNVEIATNAPAETTPPTAASNPLDMDAFMAAWGSDEGTWDVDGSGRVDGSDLGAILSAQSAAASGDEAIDSLLGSWGTADPDWDLNGDGIVNGIDLGMHLNGESGSGGTAGGASLTLGGFAGAWGTDDAAYDLNGDGIVDGADLGQYLADHPGEAVNIDTDALVGLLDAWGSDSAEHDHDGDGVVGGGDLGRLLAGEVGGGGSTAREAAPGNERLDQIANRLSGIAFETLGGGAETIATTSAGLLGHLDLDGDGQVSRNELFDSIRGRLDQLVGPDGAVDGDRLRGFIGKWMQQFGHGGIHADPVQNANHRHGIGHLKSKAMSPAIPAATDAAAHKVERVLSSLGTDALPPNLPNLLGRVALPGTHPDAVMMQLLSKHPIGGIETTA